MVLGLRDYDRRKSKRFNTEICTGYSAAKMKTETGSEGMVTNLSHGGLELDLYDKLGKKAHILVEIPLKWAEANLTVGGRVVWLRSYGDLISCGIKIDWISNEEEYREYIERLGIVNGRR